jgi:transposase
MGTASVHEGVRRMRFESLVGRWERGDLTQIEAAEILGVSVRTFQRWVTRFEEAGAMACRIAASAGRHRVGLPRRSWSGCWASTGTSTRTCARWLRSMGCSARSAPIGAATGTATLEPR